MGGSVQRGGEERKGFLEGGKAASFAKAFSKILETKQKDAQQPILGVCCGAAIVCAYCATQTVLLCSTGGLCMCLLLLTCSAVHAHMGSPLQHI